MILFKNASGFTLVELLVTVGIVGILASIAIPQFSDYKQKAYDAAAISDVRGVMLAQEAYFIDKGAYGECFGSAECQTMLPGFRSSNHVGVNVSTVISAAGYSSFTALACTIKGTPASGGGFRLSSASTVGRKQFMFSTLSPQYGIRAADLLLNESVCASWDDD